MKGALLFMIAVGILTGFAAAKTERGSKHCIHLTPEKEAQIEDVVERFTIFLNKLSQEMEDIDLKLVNLEIDEHSEDEGPEKETVLQLTVNNCVRKASETDDVSEASSNYTSANAATVANSAVADEGQSTTAKPIKDEEDNKDENNDGSDRTESSVSLSEYNEAPERKRSIAKETKPEECNNKKENVTPSVYFLNLAPKGRGFVDELRRIKNKSSPLVVYVEDLIPSHEQLNKTERKDAIDKPNGKTKHGKPVPEVLDLKLPQNGELILKEFSKKNGNPIVIYVEDLPDLQKRRYVFIDK